MNNELKEMYGNWRRRMASSYAPPDYSCEGPARRRYLPEAQITGPLPCTAVRLYERQSLILWLIGTSIDGMYFDAIYKSIKENGFEGTHRMSISEDLHALHASGHVSRTEDRSRGKRYRYRRTTKIWN